MTNNQIKRILSGLNLSTAKNEVLVIPYFRTIISETRQGVDGASDQLKFDYDNKLIRMKDYYYTKVLLPLYPYEVSGREIKFMNSFRRITVDDVIVIADYSNHTLTKIGNVISNQNYVITVDDDFTFNPGTQKMFFAKSSEYDEAVPSPRDPLTLLKYQAMSNNAVDTYINIETIVAIDTYNATIDVSLV